MNKTLKIGASVLSIVVAAVLVTVYTTKNPIDPLPASDVSFATPADFTVAAGDMKVSIIITAMTDAPEAIAFEGGRLDVTRKLAQMAVAICHTDGLLLVDTGLGQNIDAQFEDIPFILKPLFSYTLTETVVDQFDRDKFCPGRPMDVVLTHLHWDHASGIEDFDNVPVWAGPRERESALAAGNGHGYLQAQIDSPNIDWQTLPYADAAYWAYSQSYDFFGDGRVVMVPMKGHSDGSVGVFLNLSVDQKYFFTGDTTWVLEGFTRPAHKQALMRTIADGDVDDLEEEIQRVNALMEHQPSLNIVPAHDYLAYPDGGIYPDVLISR